MFIGGEVMFIGGEVASFYMPDAFEGKHRAHGVSPRPKSHISAHEIIRDVPMWSARGIMHYFDMVSPADPALEPDPTVCYHKIASEDDPSKPWTRARYPGD